MWKAHGENEPRATLAAQERGCVRGEALWGERVRSGWRILVS